MKKYLLIAIVACGLSLTACGGGQKAENAQTNEDAVPAVTATSDSTVAAPADAATPDSVAAPQADANK